MGRGPEGPGLSRPVLSCPDATAQDRASLLSSQFVLLSLLPSSSVDTPINLLNNTPATQHRVSERLQVREKRHRSGVRKR